MHCDVDQNNTTEHIRQALFDIEVERIDHGVNSLDDEALTQEVIDRAVQILGGHGYIREHPVEMWMRNGRGFAMFTGLAIV